MDSLILLSFVLKRLYRSDDENRFNEKWRNCRMNANSSAFAQAGRRFAGSRWSMIIGSIPSRRSNERATSGNAFSSEPQIIAPRACVEPSAPRRSHEIFGDQN